MNVILGQLIIEYLATVTEACDYSMSRTHTPCHLEQREREGGREGMREGGREGRERGDYLKIMSAMHDIVLILRHI